MFIKFSANDLGLGKSCITRGFYLLVEALWFNVGSSDEVLLFLIADITF